MCGSLHGHMQISAGAVCLKLKICLSCAIVLSGVSFFRDAVISVTMKEEGGNDTWKRWEKELLKHAGALD